MPQILNPRVIFSSVPKGHPDAETFTYLEDECVDIETVNLEGGILVEVLALSLDPYMRNRMRPIQEPGDMPAFGLNDNVTGFGVGRVLRSEKDGIEAGSHVYRFMRTTFKKFAVFPTTTAMSLEMPGLGLKVLNDPYKLPWHYFVGALGMSGQTAYYGLKDLASPIPGETLFVSAACGAVDHLVIQMAKLQKLKVIASCGTDEKVALALRLGADHAFNYRTSHTGRTLEAAIENANTHARFVICLMNLWLLSRYIIRMDGMVMTDWAKKYEEEFFNTIPQYLASGDVKYVSHEYKGLESTATAFANMLMGGNIGKTVIILDEDVATLA
ncbi:hypothetical protein DFS33DRAFT_1375047 [Desarmillaria ectypa]|nr:hypothetical protein DFS33DRAFT_1375047 [Desarmillaria ectypa]